MEKTTETTLADLEPYAPIPEILRDMADICDWLAKRYQELDSPKADADYRFVSSELYPALQDYIAKWISRDGFKIGEL